MKNILHLIIGINAMEQNVSGLEEIAESVEN
jgi:hypothetical protein